jgi:hypothetical protein
VVLAPGLYTLRLSFELQLSELDTEGRYVRRGVRGGGRSRDLLFACGNSDRAEVVAELACMGFTMELSLAPQLRYE